MAQTYNDRRRLTFLILTLWLLLAAPGGPAYAQRQHAGDVQVSAADLLRLNAKAPFVRSAAALVMDQREGVVLFGRHADDAHPIASVTKLMTAMVTLDAALPMDDIVTIERVDRDRLRGSGSRLAFGVRLTRRDVLRAALAASDNRAAAALGRTYPGGRASLVRAMNVKAHALGMQDTHFTDPAGLGNGNVSTARDVAAMVAAAGHYAAIRRITTTGRFFVTDHRRHGRPIEFFNTDRLVRGAAFDITLSKTGYTDDAGNCLVMQAVIGRRPVIIVLLDSWGKLSKYGDARRIRHWLLKNDRRAARLRMTAAGT